MNKILFSAIALMLFGCIVQAQKPDGPYKLVKTIKLSGDDGWDYLTVDSKNGRLFVSHGSQVQIVDIEQGKEIASIPAIGVHGIALAPELNKGFISNGKDSSVTIFDLTSLKTITKINVTGKNPDAIMYDPFTKRVFTFNGKGRNSTVIDAQADKVIGTIDLGAKPEFSVSDGKGNVYVNLEDKSMVSKIDPKEMKVVASWPIAPGESASGMALDKEHNLLFLGCDNNMMIIMDASTGKVVQNVPIGEGVDANAYDPGTGLAFSSNGAGTLTVVHEDAPGHFRVLANVPTKKGARTMALDEKTHRVYLPCSDYDGVEEGKKHRPKIAKGSFGIMVMEKQ